VGWLGGGGGGGGEEEEEVEREECKPCIAAEIVRNDILQSEADGACQYSCMIQFVRPKALIAVKGEQGR